MIKGESYRQVTGKLKATLRKGRNTMYRRLKDLTRKERRELNRIIRKQRRARKNENIDCRTMF